MEDKDVSARAQRAIVLYETAIDSFAARTRNMIEQHGELGALSKLMLSPDLQKGFKVLRDRQQLDLTFEQIVLDYRHLFRPEVVEAAEWRLANPYGLLES